MSGTILTYGAFSDYLEKNILAHVFGSTTFAKPAGIYVGLFTAASTDTTPGGEPPGSAGYARIAATFAVGPDQPEGSSTYWNTNLLQFAAASENWGTIGWVGIFDAVSGGNLLAHGPLVTPKPVDLGDAVRFSVNQLVVGLQ